MSEKPTNLEYSKYDEEAVQNNENIRNMRERILGMERKIQKYKALIEDIRTNPEISEDERKELIIGYMRSIGIVQRTIKITQENIGLTELSMGVDQILKEQTDGILRRGEHLDELTADIEQEDEPPRSVN